MLAAIAATAGLLLLVLGRDTPSPTRPLAPGPKQNYADQPQLPTGARATRTKNTAARAAQLYVLAISRTATAKQLRELEQLLSPTLRPTLRDLVAPAEPGQRVQPPATWDLTEQPDVERVAFDELQPVDQQGRFVVIVTVTYQEATAAYSVTVDGRQRVVSMEHAGE